MKQFEFKGLTYVIASIAILLLSGCLESETNDAVPANVSDPDVSTPPPSGNQSPSAVISATPSSGAAALQVQVDGSQSSDDGTIVSYQWDFGDGNSSQVEVTSHIYSQTGSYTLTLTVTDDESATDSTSTTISVFESVGNGNQLFVDGSTGDDSRSYAENSASTPWATIGRAAWGSTDRNSPDAAEAAQPGDTVTVLAGTYVTTQMPNERYIPSWNPVNSGTPGNPIVFRAVGEVILQSVLGGANGPVIGAFQRDYITWDGFFVDEPNIETRADTGPVVIWDSDNVIIQNLEIRGKTAQWVDNHNGIRLEFANNAIVRGNKIYGIRRMGGVNRNAAAIMTYDSNNILIEANEIFDSYDAMYVKNQNNNFVVRHNLVYDIEGPGLRLSQIGCSATAGALIYRNVFRNNAVGVSFSPIQSDGHNEPYCTAPYVNNIRLVNNTIVDNAVGITIKGSALNLNGDALIENNIVTGSDTAINSEDSSIGSAFTIQNNLYFGNGEYGRLGSSSISLTSMQNSFGIDSGSFEANPLFADEAAEDFRLQADSPAINAGMDVMDLNGNNITAEPINFGADMNGAAGSVAGTR
jgi:PKD repeat protein